MDLGWLWERIRSAPELPAIISGDRVCTYRNLAEECLLWQEVLRSRRIGPGHIVAIRGDYSREACSLLLALVENDCIIVPLTSVSRHQHEFFLETAEVQTVFEIVEGEECRVEDREVEVKNPLLLKLRQQRAPGLVVFSSGSTGVSKGVLHNFAALLEKYKVSRQRFRTMTFLLWDHLGGINTLFYTFSNTGTVVVVEDRTPEAICRLIEKHKVQLLPTSPTFLNLLIVSEVYHHFDLSSLQLVTYGTEPMPASTLMRIREILPEVSLQQTYGLTELGVVRSKSKEHGSLWVKIGGEGFETKVVDGILWIRAQSAMMGYLNAPDPFNEDGWFNTGDEVEVDGEYLLIKGRRSEMINVGGEKVFPAEVESVILECPNVKDVCVSGEKNPITGSIVVAKVNLETKESPIDFRKRLREFCRGRLVPFKIPARVEIVEGPLYNERVKRIRRNVGAPKSPTGNQDT